MQSIEESHVYRMLQEDQEQPHEPRQSGSFKALQDYVESDGELPLSWTPEYLEGDNIVFTRCKVNLTALIQTPDIKFSHNLSVYLLSESVAGSVGFIMGFSIFHSSHPNDVNQSMLCFKSPGISCIYLRKRFTSPVVWDCCFSARHKAYGD